MFVVVLAVFIPAEISGRSRRCSRPLSCSQPPPIGSRCLHHTPLVSPPCIISFLSIFMMPSEQPKSDVSDDIFSLSDRVLAEKLLFVKEVRFPIPNWPCTPQHTRAHSFIQIGFGNWGSVWLCRPRVPNRSDTKLAVKLVHRSKTTTTAARVRSLLVVHSIIPLCVSNVFAFTQVE